MVDTVKILLTIYDPRVLGGGTFAPLSAEQLATSYGTARTYLNPSPSFAKAGVYMPRLTLYRRPSKVGISYQLAVEFSAPKMLYNNNFDEITEAEFDELLTVLQSKLFELTGYRFPRRQLAQANISAWHPCKNIVFLDFTSCQTVINTIGKLDISRVYDLQRTNFRDGHVIHIHCNSLDIAFYDKLADLRKAKVSEKRAFESGNAIQLQLLEPLRDMGAIEVLRQEVRFVGKASVKRAFPGLTMWTFEALFKKDLCQAVLLKHWHRLTASIDMLSLDTSTPYELFQNYLIENPDVTPQTALAATAALLINGKEGVVNLRNLLDARFGSQAWSRVKKIIKSPQSNRYKHFDRVEEVLNDFVPTHLSEYLKRIENTSK